MPLVESRSHIMHDIPSVKMTAKNDLQTEYVYNSVGVIEANVGHFGHGRFGHGHFGQDISATDISAM